jgi:hypothetical protein
MSRLISAAVQPLAFAARWRFLPMVARRLAAGLHDCYPVIHITGRELPPAGLSIVTSTNP